MALTKECDSDLNLRNIVLGLGDFHKRCFEDYEGFFRSHLSLNHDIIISYEGLAMITKKGIHRLKEMLEGYDVTVVGFYRPFMDRHFSFLGEGIHDRDASVFTTHPDPFFKNYVIALSKRLISPRTSYSLWDSDLFESYASVFGFENVMVVDWYGSLAAGIQSHVVIMCDVLKSCVNESTNIDSFVANAHHPVTERFDWQARVLVYNSLTNNKNCQVASDILLNSKNLSAWERYFKPLHIPILLLGHRHINSVNVENDRIVRHGFPLMLYANITTNMRYVKDWKYEELDEAYFSNNETGRREYNELKKLLSADGYAVGCL